MIEEEEALFAHSRSGSFTKKVGGTGSDAAGEEEEDEENEDASVVADLPYDQSTTTTSERENTGMFRDRPAQPRTIRHHRRKRLSNLARVWEISKEALPTLVLSLVSLMFSGELLVHLARWPVFMKVDKLFILIPILLNLKGNLEMNLSLRMSTSANIGELDIRRTRQTLIVGNMTLLQVQALIVSAAAGIVAFLLGYFADGHDTQAKPLSPATTTAAAAGANANTTIAGMATSPSLSPVSSLSMTAVRSLVGALRRRRLRTTAISPPSAIQRRRIIHHHPKPPSDPALRLRNGYFEFVLVLATGMLSASLSSAILGNFMCALVVVARQSGANPDNIASPLAASLGDLLTLTIVGLLGSALIHFEGTILATLIFVGLLVACIVCFMFTLKNTYVRELLSSGWVPLIMAMFISSGAGLVLDSFVQKYQGFALLAPVITGLPGACAAIFVSRTSTALHSGKGEVALNQGHQQQRQQQDHTSKPGTFFRRLKRILRLSDMDGPAEGWLVPWTLLTIGVLIEVLFLSFVWLTGQMTFGWPFLIAFSTGSVAAVGLALLVAHVFTIGLWKRDYDPGECSEACTRRIVMTEISQLTYARPFSPPPRHLLFAVCLLAGRRCRPMSPRCSLYHCHCTWRQHLGSRQCGRGPWGYVTPIRIDAQTRPFIDTATQLKQTKQYEA